jgi:hypothetical protein
LLTNELPFKANSPMGWAAAHLRDTPTPTAERRPELSPAVAQLVDGCLAKDPDKRPTAQDIARGMLPMLDAQMDWPPPGLGWLHGRARTLSRVGFVAALGAILATASFTLLPSALTTGAGWLGRFPLAAQLSASPTPAAGITDTTALMILGWQAAMVLGLAAYALASLGFVTHLFRIADYGIRQRLLGWKLETLYDVAVDHDGHTGNVQAGSGDFASLGERRRGRILIARRLSHAAILLGASWIIAGFGAATVGIDIGLITDVPEVGLFSMLDTVVVLSPGLALLLLGAVAGLFELWQLGRLGRQHGYDASAEDVAVWYRSLPTGTSAPAAALPPQHERAARWGSQILQVVVALAAAAALTGAVMSGLALLTASRFTQRHGPGPASLLAEAGRFAAWDPIGTARSDWTPYRPEPEDIPPRLANQWLTRLVSPATGADGLPAYDLPLGAFFARDAASGTLFTRAASGRIPSDTVALLQRLASHPRTLLLRRIAAAREAALPTMSATATGDSGRPAGTPFLFTRRVTEAARANVLAAVFDAVRGDFDVAAARIGENAAVADHLLDAPHLLANKTAVGILRDHVLRPLASLERARGNADRAARLSTAADRLVFTLPVGGVAALAAHTGDLPRLADLAADTRIPRGYRVAWLTSAWVGLCAHPREILLGPSAERRQELSGVVDSVNDIQGLAELMTASERIWTRPFTGAAPTPGRIARIAERLFLGAAMRLVQCNAPVAP